MTPNSFTAFRQQVANVVSRNPRRTEKLIGGLSMLGNGLVAVIPAVKSGFVDTLIKLQPGWSLLERAYTERPLPVAISVAGCFAGIAIHRGRFTLYSMIVTGCSLAFIGDFLRSGEYYSIASMVPNLAGGIFGMFHGSLTRRFIDSKSLVLRHTLGQPKSTMGKLLCATAYPLVVTSLLDGNFALCVSAVAWSVGNGGPVATEPKVRFRPETGLGREVRRTAYDPKLPFINPPADGGRL